MFKRSRPPQTNSSWQNVAKQYHRSVGDEGHYYHQKVVMPNLIRQLILRPGSRILDLACGQGVLAHHLPKEVVYVGVDLAESLIRYAKQNQDKAPLNSTFIHADITKKMPVNETNFDVATVILAIQNVKSPDRVFTNAAHHLHQGGELIIVMNHPCFRIPRQSAWGIDEKSKLQYRRLNRYLTPMEIPIEMNPGRQPSRASKQVTFSYHFPLGYYFQELAKAGFVVSTVEEWASDKHSAGKMKKMEDRARSEFPLFLMIKAKKA